MATRAAGPFACTRRWFVLGLGLLLSILYLSLLRQRPLSGYEYAALAILTGAALAFDDRKLGQFLDLMTAQRAKSVPHMMAVDTALAATLKLPILVRMLRTELLTLYYAFFAKAEADPVIDKAGTFSVNRSSNANDSYLFVAVSQLPFLPFVHALVEYRKGPGAAWIITLLTLWSVLWFKAQVQAVRLRPVELRDEFLAYRFGLSWEADIPLDQIRSARAIEVTEDPAGSSLFRSPFGSARNVLLEFSGPVQFVGPWFIRAKKRRAAIAVDDPSRFLQQLAARGVAAGRSAA